LVAALLLFVSAVKLDLSATVNLRAHKITAVTQRIELLIALNVDERRLKIPLYYFISRCIDFEAAQAP